MDSKFYVSPEAEELLKEKGYPFVWGYDSIHPRKVTKAEAIDWLQSKGIVVETIIIAFGQTEWFCRVTKLQGVEKYFSADKFQTRLEAEEAAIIKALELL